MAAGLSPRAARVAVWGLGFLPILWFAAFWLFVLRARLALGRWPSPYDPDPKDLGFSIHYYFLVLGFAWVPAAIITLLVVAGLSLRAMRAAGARPWFAASVAVVTYTVIIAFARYDPGWFFAWFGD
jgi:hypothetical protein